MSINKYLISVIGPTAIGKTSLSIKLANHFNTEIISADSRQFYKEMHIGTAAPTNHELKQAKHHFIHHKSITDDYSVGSFEKDAIHCLNKLYKSYNVVIMVGGSGLYVDAVIKGLDYFPEVNKSIREKLNKQLEQSSLQTLQNQLRDLDPITYKLIAIDNPHRVIRALEICIGTGTPYSSYLNKEKTPRDFKTITIGLMAERQIIYERINQRVDVMMKEGLLDEVKNLEKFKHLNALNTVGYKELFGYLDNKYNLEFAVSEIKKNTRRFAKRQLTWFKKNKDALWFDYQTDIDYILGEIKRKMNESD